MKADILPPFVIITGAFVVIGVGLSGFHKLMNNGKVRASRLSCRPSAAVDLALTPPPPLRLPGSRARGRLRCAGHGWTRGTGSCGIVTTASPGRTTSSGYGAPFPR